MGILFTVHCFAYQLFNTRIDFKIAYEAINKYITLHIWYTVSQHSITIIALLPIN